MARRLRSWKKVAIMEGVEGMMSKEMSEKDQVMRKIWKLCKLDKKKGVYIMW